MEMSRKLLHPAPHPSSQPGWWKTYLESFLQWLHVRGHFMNQKRQEPGNIDARDLIPGVPLSTIWPWEILPPLWACFLGWEAMLASKRYPRGYTILLEVSMVSQVELLWQRDELSWRNLPCPILWGISAPNLSLKLTCKYQPPGQCPALFWIKSGAGALRQTVPAPGLTCKGSSRCWNHSAEPHMAWDLVTLAISSLPMHVNYQAIKTRDYSGS